MSWFLRLRTCCGSLRRLRGAPVSRERVGSAVLRHVQRAWRSDARERELDCSQCAKVIGDFGGPSDCGCCWVISGAVYHLTECASPAMQLLCCPSLRRMCVSTHRPTDTAVASSLGASLTGLQLLQTSCRRRSLTHSPPGASISMNGFLIEWRDAFVPSWTQGVSFRSS